MKLPPGPNYWVPRIEPNRDCYVDVYVKVSHQCVELYMKRRHGRQGLRVCHSARQALVHVLRWRLLHGAYVHPEVMVWLRRRMAEQEADDDD